MGGGAMGPPLMDDEWIYGAQPENIFATIVQGRPNGMPAFGPTHSEEELWGISMFVKRLPAMDGAEYARLRREAAEGEGEGSESQTTPTHTH